MNAETREVSVIVERAEAMAWEDIVAAAPADFAKSACDPILACRCRWLHVRQPAESVLQPVPRSLAC